MEILPCPFLAMSFLYVVSSDRGLYKQIILAHPWPFGLSFKYANKSFNSTEWNAIYIYILRGGEEEEGGVLYIIGYLK